MEEVEVRLLFLIILNSYNGFAYDDDKVNTWTDLLWDVPFVQAQSNLRKYILNTENKFPPHPGVLAETMVQRSEGPYIPNAAETRLMLEERDRVNQSLVIPMPAYTREELRQLVKSRDSVSGNGTDESTPTS
jgi:hypothetical protein